MSKIVAKNLKSTQYYTLETLFEEWKESHLEDVEISIVKKTFPKGTEVGFQKSFCWDGYIGDNNLSKILFVCRESNLDGKAETNDFFWIKSIVQKRKGKYFNCLNAIATQLNESIFECGYMNINKRGGLKSCLMSRLKNYSLLYKNYILKEIELLNPERIVILGNLPSETISIIKESNKPIFVYPFHPCVYRKSEIEKIEELLI